MNYRYKLVKSEYILDEEEHKKCLSGMAGGKPIVILRGGKLILNMNHLVSSNETGELTEKQEKDRENSLKLEQVQRESQGSGRDFMKEVHASFYKKMGWEHGSQCACKSWVLN